MLFLIKKMLNITKNPKPIDSVLIPEVNVFLFGKGRVDFAWNFTRKVPFWYLYYNTEPGAYLNFSGREVRPTGREIILIPPNTPFRSACEAPFEHLYLHFTAGHPYSRVRREVLIFDRSVCGTLDLLLTSERSSDAAVYALLFSALAAIPEDRFETEEVPIDRRIQYSMSLMNQGLKKKDICRKIGMSQSNFQRRFKAEIGISPHQYSKQLALEKARALLSFGTESINEIAETCGFADRYIFSKAFKKETGVSPAEYRSRRNSE